MGNVWDSKALYGYPGSALGELLLDPGKHSSILHRHDSGRMMATSFSSRHRGVVFACDATLVVCDPAVFQLYTAYWLCSERAWTAVCTGQVIWIVGQLRRQGKALPDPEA